MNGRIIDVWKHNLEEEFQFIRESGRTFPFVSFAISASFSREVRNFHTLRSFVNLSKIIQVGLCLSNQNGDSPKYISLETGEVTRLAWQINFRDFDIHDEEDARDPLQIRRLQEIGIDFDYSFQHGVSGEEFIDQLVGSKLVRNEKREWTAFEGAASFGHLIKLLINDSGRVNGLTHEEFLGIFGANFPISYDLNHVIRSTHNVPGNIEDVATLLKVQ